MLFKIYFSKLILALIFLALPYIILGQDSSELESAYIWFDNTIGKDNTTIYSGVQYVEKHRMLNDKHKFFENPNFSLGSVQLDGDNFYQLQLKYDVFEDQLLLKHDNHNLLPTIILNKNLISSFSIGKNQFLNIDFTTENGTKFNGFIEILFSCKSMSLLKSHQKKIRRKTNDRIRYFEFLDQNRYYIFYNGIYQDLSEIKSFEKFFHNTTLNEYFKLKEGELKSLIKKGSDDKLITILEGACAFLDEPTPQQ